MSNVNNMASSQAKFDFHNSLHFLTNFSGSEQALQEREVAISCALFSVCSVVITVFVNEKFVVNGPH